MGVASLNPAPLCSISVFLFVSIMLLVEGVCTIIMCASCPIHRCWIGMLRWTIPVAGWMMCTGTISPS